MNSELSAASVIKPKNGSKTALLKVSANGVFNDLFLKMTVNQTFKNIENTHIEAVYTFPLPLNAVLMEMRVEVGGKVLYGEVFKKNPAENIYNTAAFEGEFAVMLEMIEPGLYAVNIGNIAPFESVTVSITYLEIYAVKDGVLRFTFPTAIAPRYGGSNHNSSQTDKSVDVPRGLLHQQVPEYDFIGEMGYDFRLTFRGVLSKAEITSPTHMISVRRSNKNETTATAPKNKTWMDRDLIINVIAPSKRLNFALTDKDTDGYCACLSMTPVFKSGKKTGRCVTVVIDCSASMTGDALHQSITALEKLLELLSPRDYFNVVRFGADMESLFDSPVKATMPNTNKAREMLNRFHSDMGGTEIAEVLDKVMEIPSPDNMEKDVVLITDGDVWNWEEITETKAGTNGVRFFILGVGSAPTHSFLQRLAEVTGGIYQPVTPSENIIEKIMDVMKHIHQARTRKIDVKWPLHPVKSLTRIPQNVYSGETVRHFAQFDHKPCGMVRFIAELENGDTLVEEVEMGNFIDQDVIDDDKPETTGLLARFAASASIRAVSDTKEISAVSEKYRIMSPETNYILMEKRDEDQKTEGVPELRKPPHMFAAGWAGLGTISENIGGYSFSRKSSHRSTHKTDGFTKETARAFFSEVADHLAHNPIQTLDFDKLGEWGLPAFVSEELKKLEISTEDEFPTILLFLYILTDVVATDVVFNETVALITKEMDKIEGITEEHHLEMSNLVQSMIV